MKMKNLLLCTVLLGSLGLCGQVKIGDNPQTIDLASLLELESSDKVLVVSKVTTTQMNGIMPLQGAIVYNSDLNCLFYYDGLQWNSLCEELPIEFATNAIVNTAPTIVITQNGDIVNFEVGEIGSENIVDFSIGGQDIQNNTITNEKLAANSVGTEELQDNTITDAEMDFTEVTLSDFTNDAGFITGATIVSADAGNNLSIGTDGGAYFNAEYLEMGISQLRTDLDLKEDLANKSTDINLGNSDDFYPSQNAVKTYVDNAIGGSTQTIVSADTGNNITAGADGGAFLDLTPLQNQVISLDGVLNDHIAEDGDLSATNEQITSIALNGNNLEISEGGVLITGDLSGLELAGATDEQNIEGSVLAGETLTIGIENGQSEEVDLSSFALDTDVTVAINASESSDGDMDSTNEIELPPGGNSGEVLSTDGLGGYSWISNDGIDTHFGNTNLDVTTNRNHRLNGNDIVFTGAGSIGIGTITPMAKLHVSGAQVRAGSFSTSPTSTANNPGYRFSSSSSNDGMFMDIDDQIGFSTGGEEAIRIIENQFVGIGLSSPEENLHVAGNIRTDGNFISSNTTIQIPDYVFHHYFLGDSDINPNYQMLNLTEVKEFVVKYHHLPGIASAEQVEKNGGLNLNASLVSQLEKIEELFLHTIEQQEKIEALTSENESLKRSMEEMQRRMDRMESILLNNEGEN